MGKRAVQFVIAGALVSAVFAAMAAASSPFTVFSIPGLEGKRIELGGVARLSDGGAIVAAGVGGSARLRIAVTRLNADGSVDLAYGTEGTSHPSIATGVRPTALAVDPATGEAWIGLLPGRNAPAEVVALDAAGHVRTAFGRRGHLALPGTASALAWNRGRLLIAAGSAPCHGCVVTIVDSRTGREIHRVTLNPRYLTGNHECTVASITSAALSPSGFEVATSSSATSCDPQLISYSFVTQATGLPTTLPGGGGTALVSVSGRDVCVAGGSTALSWLTSAFGSFSRAPAGRVLGVVPLGDGACAALIKPSGYPAAMVLQARKGQRLANSYAIPRNVAPLGIFRCHQHLLVIGDRDRQAVLVVVPVTAGPHAQAARVTTATSRCAA